MTIDYIDPDVAYLLGLIVARGEISESGGVKRLKIEFPFRNLQVEGIKKRIHQRDKILIGLRKIRSRINELTDMNIREEETEDAVILIMESMKNSIFWRNLRLILGNRTTHYEFEIPSIIFESESTIKKEFLRGFADVAGSARYSNRNRWGKCRIYLDVLNPNWRLPVQLCHLLQDHLHVPVDTITWGHPNIRDPKLKDYRNGRRHAWAREHQIKIFADDFKQIGFYMEHKQEILEELAEYNEVKGFEKAKYCDPPKEIRKKPRHPEENSDKLPETLRGRHYDSSWQICADLGCWRYNNYIRKQKRLI